MPTQTFTSSGSWTCPAGVQLIKALNTGSRVAIQKLVKLGWTIYGGDRV